MLESERLGMIRAIEENGAEFLLALGRAAGAEERREEHIHWIIGNSPIDYHNCVVRAHLPADRADREIAASIEALRAHRVPGSWHVGPSMSPPDLGGRLVSLGYAHAGDDIGMAMRLDMLPGALPIPEGLSVERVRDERMLLQWVETLSQGFGEGPVEAEWVGEMYRRIGLGDETPWRHYVGFLHGAAEATASVFFGAGAAGVYFVMTVPEERRRGIGAAVTLRALQDARAEGQRVGVLGSSAMGERVYRRLGFIEYCRIGIYEWR